MAGAEVRAAALADSMDTKDATTDQSDSQCNADKMEGAVRSILRQAAELYKYFARYYIGQWGEYTPTQIRSSSTGMANNRCKCGSHVVQVGSLQCQYIDANGKCRCNDFP